MAKPLLRINFFFIFILFNNCVIKEKVYEKYDLPKKLHEISGLEFYKNNLIGFNDSGNLPIIYILDDRFNVVDEIKINCENIDWEDITYDGINYYISDLGNNYGNRQNLRILKFDKSFKFLKSLNIKYTNQIFFDKDTLNQFDSEALVSYKNKLIIFSKNRKNLTSELYLVDKENEFQSLSKVNSFNSSSLITGGDYSGDLDTLILIGYNFLREHKLFIFNNFDLNSMLNPLIIPLGFLEGKQVESLKFKSKNEIIIASEGEKSNKPEIWKINLKKLYEN